MHNKTRTLVVTLATCAFVAGMLAMTAIPAGQQVIATRTTSGTEVDATHSIEPAGATGTKTLLVILLQFTDKAHASSNTPAFYTDLLFNLGNKQSMASYYKENSYSRLTLTGTVTTWLTSSKTMSYYGADSGDFPNIDDENGNIFELAREAVQLADPSVNYANFDQNTDGYVDNLIVIHAGDGQESSSSANDIWSHQWEIQPAQTTSDSGKKAEHYALFAEESPVGVIAHEFGHVLGLPDMYDYTYSGQVFVGNWALMDSGSWNGAPAGSRPSHMISWSKLQLGFITPAEREVVGINEVKNVTIIPTHLQTLPSGSKRVAVINISTGIYYTVEVRNSTYKNSTDNPFDRALPDSGVLITFCNDSATEETFYGRPGVCVVQNAKPSDPSNDHAPFDLGTGEVSEFDDPDRNVKVRILSINSTNGAYKVQISHIQLELTWMYVNGSDVWQMIESHPFSLLITLKNTGSTTLTSVDGTLSSTTGGVSISPSSRSWGTISAGAKKNNTLAYIVTLGSIAGTPMNFSLSVDCTEAALPFVYTIKIPVQKESVKPSVYIQAPATNGTTYEASAPISLLAPASDAGGIFKVWHRYKVGAVISDWVEMNFDGTKAAAVTSIRDLGTVFITVRAMDTSGNIAQDTVTVVIVDTTPPSVMLSVNIDTGDPSHFAILGTELYIVAVAIDNNAISQVELSIDGGAYISMLPYPATVNMGINGTLEGYAYLWTPNIEGNHLIKLRAVDMSGNQAFVEWQITTISAQTITTIIIVMAIIIVVFSVIGRFTRRRSYGYRTRLRYRY